MTAPPGERIAKRIARAGLCSRREAERWIEDGRVAVDGTILTSPACNVTEEQEITVDGKPLPQPEETRLWLFHKPKGCITSRSDPQGRQTVFDLLPEKLKQAITIGRLDYHTEGLLLLTNDGGLARQIELPATGWKRVYRVRVRGKVDQEKLDRLKDGITIDGVRYGTIEAKLERSSSDNHWLEMAIREGKNREIRKICEHLGLTVSRLIRISYGDYVLGDLERGNVVEVEQITSY